jgi:hypothetical protein
MPNTVSASSPADYNQKFIDLVQHFDTFTSERAREQPNVFRDRIPKGTLPNFEGLVRQVNIFHGPVGEQAGLANFRRIQTSRVPNGADPGIDACAVNPKTFGYGWETRQYTGYTGEWKSEPICIADIQYTYQAKQQAEMISKTVPKVSLSVWETWNRETWLSTTVQGGNAHIMAREGQDLSDAANAQFEYDPYATRDFGGAEQETFIRYPASVQVGSLDWSHLTWWQDYLGEECPEAALAVESGYPMFGLMLHLRDFEKMIRDDADIRQDYRDAKPEVLIDGFPGAFKRFRGYILIHDARQARFKQAYVESEGGVDYVVARRVKPMKEDVAGAIGTINEANKEYQSAELAIGLIFMNEVVQNLVPVPIGSLTSDMVFGAVPGFNGEFMWLNEYDKDTNPFREVGNYFARFKIFPKPLLYHNRAISFLYSRCPHAVGADCVKVASDVTAVTSSTLARDLAAGDIDSSTYVLTVPVNDVLDLEIGQPVTITATGTGGGAGAYTGYVLNTLDPSTIQVGFNATVGATVVSGIADFDSGDTVVLG